jgi:hypothetical protein
VPSGKFVLLDRYLRVIAPTGEIFTLGAKRYLTDDDGNAIDDELGQADDGSSVLMAQPPSPTPKPQSNQLIYYGIRVNDVYAQLRTKAASSTAVTKFPTSKAEIKTLLGRDFPDISVLTVELKTAWIDVKGLKAGEEKNYITIPATLPVYKPDPPDSTKVWNRVLTRPILPSWRWWACMLCSAQKIIRKCFGQRSSISETRLILNITTGTTLKRISPGPGTQAVLGYFRLPRTCATAVRIVPT